ncbi:hypothetical protein ACTXO3_11160 [Corynebacterium casei]
MFYLFPIGEGLHTIEHKGRLFDLLIQNRGSDTTLVVFHGSLPPTQLTLPCLQGEGVSRLADVNLIALADPSLVMGDIDCAWFLGDRRIGPLRPILSPVIRYVLDSLNSKRTILFGGSGGGYAAVNFAQDFPGSIALAMNPRLNFNGTPSSKLPRYLEVCHGAMSRTPMLRVKRDFMTPNLLDDVNKQQDFDLLVVQNKNDKRYLHRQVNPFLSGVENPTRTWVSLFNGGDGHVPLPREEVAKLLKDLSNMESQTSDEYNSLGFESLGDYKQSVLSQDFS